MKITEKNGIVKWEDEPQMTKPGSIKWFKPAEIQKEKNNWYKVGDEYLHIVPDEDCIYVNGAKINLLPKESTMRTRYAVVNLREKVEFEKKWEMPYGYNNSPKICYEQKEAIGWINRNLGPNERKEYVVERHNAGKVEVVWKIVPGHTIEQEEEEYDEEF